MEKLNCLYTSASYNQPEKFQTTITSQETLDDGNKQKIINKPKD